MKIQSAQFAKGISDRDPVIDDGIPQVAFIGRSNTGKSSVINSLVGSNDLARISSFPGRTQRINFFLVNKSLYFVDLPGYGYAKVPNALKDSLWKMINWYFFISDFKQKIVVMIIDAKVGPTKDDQEFIIAMEDYKKNVVIVANKVDKLNKEKYESQFKMIRETMGDHKIIPYSAKNKIGVKELLEEIL
jgi:GTP-binding protein